MEVASTVTKNELLKLINENPADKVNRVLTIFKDCKVDEWAKQLQENCFQTALKHLDDTAVLSVRKKPTMELAAYLMVRES
jgi:geranylgeranyl diphosphate synthase type II